MPPSGRALRAVHSCLADILHTAASIIEEIRQRRRRGEQTCKRRPFPPLAQHTSNIFYLLPKKVTLPPDNKCITGTTSLPPMDALSLEDKCIAGTTSLLLSACTKWTSPRHQQCDQRWKLPLWIVQMPQIP
ncbi:unnamed protein product [Lampetra fluviatilis]